ncbi:hypothetical protein HG717_16065 [Rhodococcus erythropolis]|uniref:hypothetical protein n=1 Tax=Rhodococcus erythropolis TaxID=1833 RepID=UPI001C9A9EA4|nr:hypothetical protein [Rhodococcus erythropolis]MBY6385415.1 hypothetical protein [Rhodococcus erythropolis]
MTLSTIAFILLAFLAGCSIQNQLYGEYDGRADALKLDLSSQRPTFWPRQDDELAGIDRTKSPRINGNKDAHTVIGGDSRKFLLIRKAGDGNSFSRTLEIEDDSQYEGYVYFSNDSPTGDSENGADLVSRDTRLALDIPERVRARTSMSASILSANAQPKIVGSTVTVESKEVPETLYLKIISAEVRGQSGELLKNISPQDLAKPQGALIQCGDESEGVLNAGCSGFVTFKFEASQSAFRTDFSLGFDGGSNYANYILINGDRGIWARFIFENTGSVDQRNVRVRFNSKSPYFIFVSGEHSPQETDALGRRYLFDLQDLTNGKHVGDMPAGTQAEIIVRIEPQPGWIETLCADKEANIQGDVSVDGFYSFTTNASIYPDPSIC